MGTAVSQSNNGTVEKHYDGTLFTGFPTAYRKSYFGKRLAITLATFLGSPVDRWARGPQTAPTVLNGAFILLGGGAHGQIWVRA